MNDSPRPLFLAGATATGKSEVAILLAEKLGGEIISVDSMQVYRGLDIGTAKPSAAERRNIPHHLIDVVELSENFDAAQFVSLAKIAAQEIQSRGRVPIFCGGTGLYFKAYLEGLGEAPPADEKLRAELSATPLLELLAELEKRDAITFNSIDKKNPRRVIRALEVIRLTGKTFSAQRAERTAPRAEGELKRLFFHMARETRDTQGRINARVEKMFESGLVAEVKNLLPLGLAANRTAMQAIGYREVMEFLRGGRELTETIELIKLRTRQFAKRQMTWFRKQHGLHPIPCKLQDSPQAISDRIAENYIED